jgi:hypothetical protein
MKSYTDILEALKGKQHKLDKNKNGKLDAHDFKLLRKEESEEADLDEGLKPGQGSKPGWMLKADPKLGAAVKAAQDLAKKRKASYGNPAAGKSVKEEAEMDEAMSNDDKSSIALKALVAKKNLKQSGEKVKSVDFLKKMKDRIKDGENLKKEEVDRVERSDYKTTPSGRKSHKQIVFKAGDDGKKTVQEAKMTDAQMAKREEIVKSMKKDIAGFKDRYGDRAKEVMYATATKMAMKEESELQEGADYKVTVSHLKADKTISKHDYDVKNANDTRHAKNIAINRHTNKHGLKQGEQIYTSSQDVKPMKEEVVVEAFPYDVDHMPGKLGSRPISGQLGDGGKKDTYVKTFHAKKEKEAHEFAKSKGYVVKKHMYPAGHKNEYPHEFQVHKEEAELEEGVMKTIKRSVAGWGAFNKEKPKDVVNKVKGQDTDVLKRLHEPNTKKGKGSPAELQQKAISRELKKRGVAEEVEQLAEDAYAKAEENKRSADAAKKQGNMFDHHLHMADHHANMSEWHSSRGRHGEADKHAAKADEHQELAMKHKMKKEETELDEQAPVAPGLMKHRISVTVSEPDHPMVSKRKEKIQKTVIVTHSDNKEGARRVGEKFYAKKGYRVHDSHHAGIKEEVELDEAAKGHTIEAHGIKGMKGTPWRKTFKHEDHLNDWAEKNDSVEVHGTRDLEHAKKGTSVREEVEELDERNKENATKRKMMDASRGARWKTQNKMSGDDVRDWDGKHKTPQAQNKAIGRALRNEENDTTEKNEMAQTQLHFVQYAAEEIMDYIEQGGVIEEWYQNKLSKVHSDMESLHSYMEGESRRTGMKEEVGKLERLRQAAQSYRPREQGRFTKPKNVGQTHDKDPHGGGIFAKSKPMRNEEVELDEMKSVKDIAAAAEKRKMKEDFELEEVESGTLSYKDFVSSLLEYETKDGVYRHKGSYGSSYQGDDDEPKKKPVDSTEKRGRGRPAGAKSGARGPLAKK